MIKIKHTRFFLGPGRYTHPISITLLGKNAAGPRPAQALATSNVNSFWDTPATTLHRTSQPMPSTNIIFPPYISDSRPKGSRKQDTTNENAEAGQVDDVGGISNALTTEGTSRLNPETKYS